MPTRSGRIRAAIALAGGLALLTGGGGCSFGPKVLEQTHGRYNESVRRVYEEQLLDNIIRCRYNESPFKLTVSSIAAQYELSGGAEARPFFVAPNSSNGIFKTFTSVLPDVTAGGANRPTITLIPSSGDGIRRFLTPIAPRHWPTWARPAGRSPPSCGSTPSGSTACRTLRRPAGRSGHSPPISRGFSAWLTCCKWPRTSIWDTSHPRTVRPSWAHPSPRRRLHRQRPSKPRKTASEYQPTADGSVVGARPQGAQARPGAQPRRSRSPGLHRALEFAQSAAWRADI